MKCKVCNTELASDMKKCPHCGTQVNPEEITTTNDFKWNIQDYPKPSSKKDVIIDWQTGRILDNDAGRVYEQSISSWTEPEHISELFSFNEENERLQNELDREVDRISDSMPPTGKDGNTHRLSSSINSHFSNDFSTRFHELLADENKDTSSDSRNFSAENTTSDSGQKPTFDWSRFDNRSDSVNRNSSAGPNSQKEPQTLLEKLSPNAQKSHSSDTFDWSRIKEKSRTTRSKSSSKEAPRWHQNTSSETSASTGSKGQALIWPESAKTRNSSSVSADSSRSSSANHLNSHSGNIPSSAGSNKFNSHSAGSNHANADLLETRSKDPNSDDVNKNKSINFFGSSAFASSGQSRNSYAAGSTGTSSSASGVKATNQPSDMQNGMKTNDENAIPASSDKLNFVRFSDALKFEDGKNTENAKNSKNDTMPDTSDRQGKNGARKTDSDLSTVADEHQTTSISEDATIFSGFNRLIEAEKKFRDDMEKVSFLSPEEYSEAERAENQSQKLRFVPTISFRTIEDEYESYRRENNIPRAENLDKNETKDNKEVQIRINEPSGTKVTVKTQELSHASLNNDEKVKTREFRLGAFRRRPKNVQVSVEINATDGNASVEVTRHPDGATVVKTVDESDSGHIYTNDSQAQTDPSVQQTQSDDKSDSLPHESQQASTLITSAGNTDSDLAMKADEETAVGAVNEDIPHPGSASTDRNTDVRNNTTTVQLSSDTTGTVGGASNAAAQRISGTVIETNKDNAPSNETVNHSVIIADESGELQSSEAAQQTRQLPISEAESLTAKMKSQPEMMQSQDGFSHEPNGFDTAEPTDADSGNFWNKPDGVSKMTITDIFGPDAHRIIEEKGEIAKDSKSGEAVASDTTGLAEDARNTVGKASASVPSVQQEETAKTDFSSTPPESTPKNETSRTYVNNAADVTDRPDQKSPTDPSKKQGPSYSLILDISPEDISASASQTSSIRKASDDTLSSQMRGVSTDTIPQERQAEMREALDALDGIQEEENQRGGLFRFKAKRAEEKKHRSSKKNTTTQEQNDEMEDAPVGTVTKALIAVLVVVLVIEFSIIGIKLFAPDSGAATLISRVESQISGIFHSEEKSGFAAPKLNDISENVLTAQSTNDDLEVKPSDNPENINRIHTTPVSAG